MEDRAETAELAEGDLVGQILAQSALTGPKMVDKKTENKAMSAALKDQATANDDGEKTHVSKGQPRESDKRSSDQSRSDKGSSRSKDSSSRSSSSKSSSSRSSSSKSSSSKSGSSSKSKSNDSKDNELMDMMAKSIAALSDKMSVFMSEGNKRKRPLNDDDSDNEAETPPSKKGPNTGEDGLSSSEPEEEAEQDVLQAIDDLVDEGKVSDRDGEDTNGEDFDFLDELAQDFEVEDKVGPDVVEKVATIVKSSFTKRLPQERMKVLLDAHQRPKNCAALAPVKVNPEIWARMRPPTRTVDLELQKVQLKLSKTVSALSVAADQLIVDKATGRKPTGSVKHIMDAVALVGAAVQDLHVRRRENIKPDLNSYYRSLCSGQVPVTTQLFGDDLPKTLKDIKETSRVGAQVANKENRSSKGGYSNGKGKHFLDKRKSNKHYHSNNYKNNNYNYKNHNNYKNNKKGSSSKKE